MNKKERIHILMYVDLFRLRIYPSHLKMLETSRPGVIVIVIVIVTIEG